MKTAFIINASFLFYQELIELTQWFKVSRIKLRLEMIDGLLIFAIGSYKIGGCFPAATKTFLKLTNPSLLSLNRVTVALPVGLVPTIKVKSSAH